MKEDLREQVQSFASLRAAQRALARCMHPSRVVAVREAGRQLLIELQASGDSSAREADPDAPDSGERLERIDRLLNHLLGSTLEIVAELDFGQLRATGPKLCAQYPEEVRALIDVMLQGDLEDGKHSSLLEFLITMVCTEEWKGRRTLIHDPAKATPGLRALSSRLAGEGATLANQAVEKLESAIANLSAGEDHYEIRNEMRAYKRGLGAGIFQQDILSRVVAYNVAMFNQIAGGVDASMAIDQLADELLEEFQTSDERIAQAAGAGSERGASPPHDLLASSEFSRVVDALRARIAGSESEDASARRVAHAFDVGSFKPIEFEALESSEDDLATGLIRKAVVLSQIIRNRGDVEDALEALPIDAQHLETRCLADLVDQMTAVATKLFADSQYDQAFELSEVKTRNLAALAEDAQRRMQRASREGAGVSERSERSERSEPSEPSEGSEPSAGRDRDREGRRLDRRSHLHPDSALSPEQVALVLVAIVCIGLLALWTPASRSSDILSASDLASLSPFISSGERREVDGRPHFIGHVGNTWDYLATEQRRTVAAQVAGRLNVQGIENFSLSNARREVMVAWRNGLPVDVVPNPHGS